MTTTHTHLIDGTHSIGEIAANLPGASAVFRKFKMNFCCQGGASLAEAAQQHGVDMDDLTKALHALDESDSPPETSLGTAELIQHILIRYHAVHRDEMVELIALSCKVESVHASHPDVPKGLAELLHQMLGELEVHMKKEEIILFPAMQLNADTRFPAPIAKLRHDHGDQGEYLRQIEALTNCMTPPDDACRAWQALYVGVSKLVDDLMTHVHLENNILFPRFEKTPQE